ncbi:MAG TPA: hypothetical protein VI942_06210 [Thermoanaerobaculia bacterium]|nr:hypothetical protein [Thermoanaerobaculia bacterium]
MRALPLALLVSFAALAARADAPAPVPTAIPVEEVQAGMKGYGESVFVGQEAERFEVEVLGVLRDITPGTSYILGRLTGHDLERTGVIAGMSGSPVWIDGRLAGAVAFSWPFSQEAIAGITPIGAMREIPRSQPWGGAPVEPPIPLADLAARRFPDDLWVRALARLAGPPSSGARSAVIWGARGFGGDTLERLRSALPALAPATGQSDEGGEELESGSSVAAVFVDGDLRLAATGTVTERSGDRVLAFGHPVAGLGEISLPIATAQVITVLGSSYSSFKLANTGPIVGTFELDHSAGTAGRLGVEPEMVPLEVTIAGAEPRSFHMRLARVPDLLAIFAAVGTMGALDSTTATGGVRAVDLAFAIDVAGARRLDFRQSFDGPGAASRAVSFLLAVVDYLVRSDLAKVEVTSIAVQLTPHRQPRAAEVVGAHALATRLLPGESTEIVVELRNYRGEIERRRVPITAPAGLAGRRYIVLVGDGASLDAVRLSLEPVEPRNFEQARRLLESLSSSDELAVLGLAPSLGTTAGGESLPRLPPSVSAIWAGSAPTGRTLRTAIVHRASFAQQPPLSGVARVELQIEDGKPVEGDGEDESANGRPKRNGSGG